MASRDSDWEGVRLHVVTGKGGTGKTTVAAALALALAPYGLLSLMSLAAPQSQDLIPLFAFSTAITSELWMNGSMSLYGSPGK